MFYTIITDCQDENARGRQLSRAAAYISCPATLVGIKSDLEAAGNLTDILDAGEGSEGIVLANVAPRNGEGKKWENGTPFCFFHYKKTLVLSSIDGLTLSLIKKLGPVSTVELFDIPAANAQWRQEGLFDELAEARLNATQFRSFEFLPRAAKTLFEGRALPTKTLTLDSVAAAPHAIWWVDNFGNCKTTLLERDIDANAPFKTSFGDFSFFPRLKDVPEGEAAVIVGSSGLGEQRFLEIVLQGKSAAERFNLSSGSAIV